ncbi:hypothetical protein [Methylobacterium sp. Leaf88]|uniref:hypothetical protein n=1 Tax=Methylobacterium sp. Leaf88 TaxID=1736244 RepID=UPI0006F783D0|nr:hypothetical protein [Methylobacterium sp. Leaf88]KQO74519.1 hypothetical protein ASF20_04550 [Methylobacterium sp. Leaf88]
MFDLAPFDPASALAAFFELPRWAQIALLMMAAALVLMNSIVGTALWSRRKALIKVEELTVDLADVKARLSSETRWRRANERYEATMPKVAERAAEGPPTAMPAF